MKKSYYLTNSCDEICENIYIYFIINTIYVFLPQNFNRTKQLFIWLFMCNNFRNIIHLVNKQNR